MEYSTKIVDHHGIVAGVCQEIGLVGEIDKLVGLNAQQKVTTGEAVMAMVINALGFVSKPLYMFPGFMKNKPVELFIREGLKPEDFNDDTLGRSLDRLYKGGPTTIFMHIAFMVARLLEMERKFFHLDTSTMSVHGEYECEEDDMVPITITHGFSKEGRSDLKQFAISLITNSQGDLPMWIEALNGNTSDKKHFPQAIKEFSKKLSENGEEAYYVMDSAGYTEENIREISPLVKWISRVPENISEARKLIMETEIEEMEEGGLKGYRYKEYPSFYGGVQQKWTLVFSDEGYKREIKTLQKNIEKEREKIRKELWHFGNKEFNSKEDGLSLLNNIARRWKYHSLGTVEVVEVNKTGQIGRPGKSSSEVKKVYKIEAKFESDEEKIEKEKKRKGKFIVATNGLELESEEVVREYKGQGSVERGFRFLKDPLFFASSVFLKKPERIVSLVMIMALSLLIYSVAQHKLRKALEEKEESVPDQKGKPTKKPTMKWIFQQFEGIHLLEGSEQGVKTVIKVLNLEEVHRKILSLMGPAYEKIYFHPT